jgi:Icc protein
MNLQSHHRLPNGDFAFELPPAMPLRTAQTRQPLSFPSRPSRPSCSKITARLLACASASVVKGPPWSKVPPLFPLPFSPPPPSTPFVNLETFTAASTRRQFLQLLPGLAAVAAFPAFAAADQPTTPKPPEKAGTEAEFTFFQINDLHYLEDDCGKWFRLVVEQMKASSPEAKFALLCGDLADKGLRPALESVKEIFGTLGVPAFPIPGNHDYAADESRTAYDTVFPGRLNYTHEQGGWQFIGLDTTMGTKFDKTTIPESTFEWLKTEIPRLKTDVPTVVFTHFPLGEGVTYTPANAPALVELLLKLNLVAVFSGHWHGLSERTVGHSLLATSRCCARVRQNADKSPLKGWYVCTAKPDGTLTRRFVEFQAPKDLPQIDAAAAPKAKKPEAEAVK